MIPLIPGLIDDLGMECLLRIPYQELPAATSVCQAWRREIGLPLYRHLRKTSGLAQQLLVVAQARPKVAGSSPPSGEKEGNNSRPVAYRLTVFDPVSGSWAGLPEIPGLKDGLPMFCGVVGAGTDLVVIGGWDPSTWRASDGVYIYSFLSGKWRRGAHMPGPRRSFFGCASDDDRLVVVAGGHDEDKNALKSALMYNVVEDKWTPLADMENGRDECKVIFHRGMFHVISGYPTESQGCFGRSAEVFDFATWRWDMVSEDFLDVSATPSGCVAGPDGAIYGCIGRRSADVAVKQGEKWQVVATVPEEVRSSNWVGTCGDKLMFIGASKFGESHNGYLLDMKSCKWSKVDMPKEYDGHVQCGCVMEI